MRELNSSSRANGISQIALVSRAMAELTWVFCPIPSMPNTSPGR